MEKAASKETKEVKKGRVSRRRQPDPLSLSLSLAHARQLQIEKFVYYTTTGGTTDCCVCVLTMTHLALSPREIYISPISHFPYNNQKH